MATKDKKPAIKNDDDKTLISLAMSRKDLARVDEAAKKLRMSRAAFIRLALFSDEISVDHLPSNQ